MNLQTPPVATQTYNHAQVEEQPPATAPPQGAESKPEPIASPAPPIEVPPVIEVPLVLQPPDATSPVGEADLAYLRAKNLLIPVAGVTRKELRDSFSDARSEGRLHQALDIMAPQGTAVLAATGGKVTKLYQSDKGGIMLYQSDPSGIYVYYYAHLMRYADGVFEGKQIRRGEVIAYVGDTGNAGAGNYHLHFGISKMTSPSKWSGGEPINPYPLLADK